MKNLAVVILAAGKSTRMKSKLSKVLHPVAGSPLVYYPVRESFELKPRKVILVVGKGQKQLFQHALDEEFSVEYCIQSDALGTAHAVLKTEKLLKGFNGYVLVIPGDVPLIQSETLAKFIREVDREDAECAVVSTVPHDPTGYGRILRDERGEFVAIREEKDATDLERDINEINTGVFLARSRWLFKELRRIKTHNAQGEYYLTDAIELAVNGGKRALACCAGPHEQFLGVNDRSDLAYANKIMNVCIAEQWMAKGVTIEDPDQTYVDYGVKIGRDTSIAPLTFIRGKTRIGKDCRIEAGAVLEDAIIEDNVHVKPYTLIEKSHIKEGVIIGPFSRVRPGSLIGREARVGNFVEVKKSVLKPGVKANHLSYIGDATIGAKTNVGCGTITCNYDGVKKHKTIIGEGVFIGSDTQFIAPVRVGKGAVIGAGSTVTKNVPSGALALSRAGQVNVPNWVNKGKRRKKKR